jgi:hypothetical protein
LAGLGGSSEAGGGCAGENNGHVLQACHQACQYHRPQNRGAVGHGYVVVTRCRGIVVGKRFSRVTNSLDMLAAQMEPARQTFDPAGAGALLVTGTAAGIAGGALIGWASGSLAYGVLIGAVVGVPLGIGAVYHRYGKAM